jgi:hypothetical protein
MKLINHIHVNLNYPDSPVGSFYFLKIKLLNQHTFVCFTEEKKFILLNAIKYLIVVVAEL